jgi:hypothetical protein
MISELIKKKGVSRHVKDKKKNPKLIIWKCTGKPENMRKKGPKSIREKLLSDQMKKRCTA